MRNMRNLNKFFRNNCFMDTTFLLTFDFLFLGFISLIMLISLIFCFYWLHLISLTSLDFINSINVIDFMNFYWRLTSLWKQAKLLIPSERMFLLSSKQDKEILQTLSVLLLCSLLGILFILCQKNFLLNKTKYSLHLKYLTTFLLTPFAFLI